MSCTKQESLESKVDTTSVLKTINEKEYRFENNRVTELTADLDTIATYGVLSDIHGEVHKAQVMAQEFKKRGVDGIIITGDISLNEPLRTGAVDTRDDENEIKEVLEVVATTGVPIYVIPGNHEMKEAYQEAVKAVSLLYTNIIDMTRYRIIDGDDADLLSLPGYQTKTIPGHQFIPDDGYFAFPKEIEKLASLRQGLDNSVILITHGCGKTNAVWGPATTYNGRDVGDVLTTQVMAQNNISFAVCGHIHEAGGRAATFEGKEIQSGEWALQFSANFGTLERWTYLHGETYDSMAGILTVNGTKAKYEIVVLGK